MTGPLPHGDCNLQAKVKAPYFGLRPASAGNRRTNLGPLGSAAHHFDAKRDAAGRMGGQVIGARRCPVSLRLTRLRSPERAHRNRWILV